ncbi:MAG: glutathione S-transferase family protein [Myxococcota bacterium]
MKLYSGPLSLFTAKVRIALAEKGIEIERIEVGWSLEHRYEPHHPDVVALNPKREVPVLVDGDVVVYDSTLIFEYLEERHPVPALYPAELADRARCRQLEAAADEILFPHVWTLIDKGFYPGPRDRVALAGNRDEDALAEARNGIARYCEAREKELASRRWLCSDFSVADIANFVFLNAAATLGAPLRPEHTALAHWYERVAARPAVAREVAEMQAFVQKLFAQGAR